MRRFCIFVIYDREGELRPHVRYWLEEFLRNGVRLCIVVNGFLEESRIQELKSYGKVIFRENSGYDAGAYSQAFGELKDEISGEYDELIFCNDTMYGPFIPLSDIFGEMEKRVSADFWGFNLISASYLSHLQSYFLVFRKSILSSGTLKRFFSEIEPYLKKEPLVSVYGYFEKGLYQHLSEEGFQSASYRDMDNVDIYRNADYCIERFGFPILKRKFFAEGNFCPEKWMRIREVLQKKAYPLSIIEQEESEFLKDFSARFLEKAENNHEKADKERDSGKQEDAGKKLSAENTESQIYYCVNPQKEASEIRDYIRKHGRIYIYGAGIIATKVYWQFRKDFLTFQGFLVSNRGQREERLFNYPILNYQDRDRQAGIIIAMNRKNTQEILNTHGEIGETALSLFRE